MKNTTNQDPDGSRWTLLRGRTPRNVFNSWGAQRVHELGDTSAAHAFMIELEDGWHYAHADGTSAWCAPEAFAARNGREAEAAHRVFIAERNLTSAQRQLTEAKAALANAMEFQKGLLAAAAAVPVIA